MIVTQKSYTAPRVALKPSLPKQSLAMRGSIGRAGAGSDLPDLKDLKKAAGEAAEIAADLGNKAIDAAPAVAIGVALIPGAIIIGGITVAEKGWKALGDWWNS